MKQDRKHQEEEHNKNIVQIDIEKVLAAKNPQFLKIAPRFIINYLKKIIHQEELNDFFIKNGDKESTQFLDATLEYFKVSYNIKGIENIPQSGKFIFASNHPLGGIDGILLIQITRAIFKNVKFLVNDILLHIDNLKEFFAPINKHGSQARESAKIIEEIYTSDAQILIFPAGLISRKQKGVIYDLEWKKNFIAKAIKHKRDIIPVHISGRVSNFFYNLANLRQLLGIKANIEMLYLSNEMFKHKNKTFTFTFGSPISYKTFDKSKSRIEWAEFVKREVYKLSSFPKK